MLKGLLAGYPPLLAAGIAVTAALAIAYLVAETTAQLVKALFNRLGGPGPLPALPLPVVRRPVRAIRLSIFLVVGLVLLFPALKVAGLDPHVGFEPEAVVNWFLSTGLRIVLIAVIAAAVIRATSAAIRRVEQESRGGQTPDAVERARRVQTLGALIENAVAVFAVASAVLMVLRELRVDVLPLLTGAGILGLAVGFGAQTLVKDVISGFFLILENQVRVGDVAVINGQGGAVESIKLRTITLRDIEGTVHVFPNGSINTLANKTKDFSFAVLDVGVGYREDTDRVCDLLREVGEELRADPAFQASMLQPLEILGVDALGESAVTIKIRARTLPLKQWEVGRELRRRVKKAFDANGIEIPFPQRTVHVSVPEALRAVGSAPGRLANDPHAGGRADA